MLVIGILLSIRAVMTTKTLDGEIVMDKEIIIMGGEITAIITGGEILTIITGGEITIITDGEIVTIIAIDEINRTKVY